MFLEVSGIHNNKLQIAEKKTTNTIAIGPKMVFKSANLLLLQKKQTESQKKQKSTCLRAETIKVMSFC